MKARSTRYCARSESGWELVNAVTERDGSDLLVFRRRAD
jgi:hypothetical protein